MNEKIQRHPPVEISPTQTRLYQEMKKLYESASIQPERLGSDASRKVFQFEDGSYILVVQRTFEDNSGLFTVNMNNITAYQLSSNGHEGLDFLNLQNPFTVTIGSFNKTVEMLAGNSISIPEEHKENMFMGLISWTEKSIAEGKITEPPYKLEFTK